MSYLRKFEDLANNVSAEAARIDCTREEYIEGLELVISLLESELDCQRELESDEPA